MGSPFGFIGASGTIHPPPDGAIATPAGALVVTERGRVVARLIPAGATAEPYVGLAERFGSTVPFERLESIAGRLPPHRAPAGTTDAYLAEGRTDRSR
jgi:antitoxin (DNA-binding transcriptional repressor) of toxin-antitoxin stability system